MQNREKLAQENGGASRADGLPLGKIEAATAARLNNLSCLAADARKDRTSFQTSLTIPTGSEYVTCPA